MDKIDKFQLLVTSDYGLANDYFCWVHLFVHSSYVTNIHGLIAAQL